MNPCQGSKLSKCLSLPFWGGLLLGISTSGVQATVPGGSASANYEILYQTLDGGGTASSSASYSMAGSFDSYGGVSTTSGGTVVRLNFIGKFGEAPTATAPSATQVSAIAANLNSSVTPGDAPATFYFQFGTSAPGGSFTTPGTAGTLDLAASAVSAIAGLLPGTVYHFSLVASNVYGVTVTSDQTFSTPNGSVASRLIFYNNSIWDGDSGPSANDDKAIATDKTALRPGQKATFANYTAYSKGINGIIIDVTPLANRGSFSAADFDLRVGNDNNPSGWSTAPAPTTISLRAGAGVGGNDRVTLIWSDTSITNKWLGVKMLVTPTSGLASADIFYFGNQIGETGNTPGDTKVTAQDLLRVRNNFAALNKSAVVTNLFDINRDGKVTSADLLIVRAHFSTVSTSIKLLDFTTGSAGVFSSDPVLASLQSRNGANPTGNQPSSFGAASGGLVMHFGKSQISNLHSSPSHQDNDVLIVESAADSETRPSLLLTDKLANGSWVLSSLVPELDSASHVWRWTIPVTSGQASQFFKVASNPLPASTK